MSTDGNLVTCACDHLSVFAATMVSHRGHGVLMGLQSLLRWISYTRSTRLLQLCDSLCRGCYKVVSTWYFLYKCAILDNKFVSIVSIIAIPSV